MIFLPSITLVALTDKDIKGHMQALYKSMEGIEFGKTLLLSPRINGEGGNFIAWDEGGTNTIEGKSIELLGSIDAWNKAIIYELPKYIKTSHALLIHQDGHVINPHLWKDEWLELDYIGAPLPLPIYHYSYPN